MYDSERSPNAGFWDGRKLWPADTHVNYDANVNTTVNKLRQVLGDSTDKPLYIETIPRKGYCLLVQPEASAVPVVLQPATPAAAAETNSEDASPDSAAREAQKWGSGIWIPLGVIGLILAGMLLGAGITTLWISHFAQTSPWP